ncbi:hypothetical protein OA264_02860 [Alphaproteobacteria bacterium]|nr:hypothetical protein [Alphaproteobacteria bacterium]
MENKFFKAKHLGTSWNHFKARDLHRINLNKKNEVSFNENKKNNTPFSWIIDTINPLNHLPIVNSVKNIVTKSNKSLDIIQSAVGGFLFAGPIGVLKGIGGWAFNKVANKFIVVNTNKVDDKTEIKSSIKNYNDQLTKNKLDEEQKSFSKENASIYKTNKFTSKKQHLTGTYINNYEIFTKHTLLYQSKKNYSETTNNKNKINISA